MWGVEGALWQADHSIHQVPARLDPTDIGTLIPDELNGTPSRRFSTIATGHHRHPVPGAWQSLNETRWAYATDLLATATVDGG